MRAWSTDTVKYHVSLITIGRSRVSICILWMYYALIRSAGKMLLAGSALRNSMSLLKAKEVLGSPVGSYRIDGASLLTGQKSHTSEVTMVDANSYPSDTYVCNNLYYKDHYMGTPGACINSTRRHPVY